MQHVLDGTVGTGKGDGLPRQRKAVNSQSARLHQEPHVLNRVRQSARALAGPSANRLGQLALLAQAKTAINKIAGGQWTLALVVLIAVLLIVGVLWPAIWSQKPSRRKAALAVLDRLLRWRG
jgi:hypothetical protein